MWFKRKLTGGGRKYKNELKIIKRVNQIISTFDNINNLIFIKNRWCFVIRLWITLFNEHSPIIQSQSHRFPFLLPYFHPSHPYPNHSLHDPSMPLNPPLCHPEPYPKPALVYLAIKTKRYITTSDVYINIKNE
jgi:hypothetical protein